MEKEEEEEEEEEVEGGFWVRTEAVTTTGEVEAGAEEGAGAEDGAGFGRARLLFGETERGETGAAALDEAEVVEAVAVGAGVGVEAGAGAGDEGRAYSMASISV